MDKKRFYNEYLIYFLLLIFGLSCLPRITLYTEEIAYVNVLSGDEYYNYLNLERILNPSEFYFEEYIKLFTEDLSGSMWWAFMALAAFPFKLMGSEQGMIISIRIILLLLPTLGIFWLIYRILSDFAKDEFSKTIIYVVLAFSFYTIVNVDSVSMTFPEPVYGFFIMLSFYFLYKANGKFDRDFYYSVVFYGVSVSIKMVGLLYGVVYIVYFIKNIKSIDKSVYFKSAAAWVSCVFSMNLILLHPEVRKSYYDLFVNASNYAKTGFPEFKWYQEFPSPISLFSKNYIDIYAFMLIMAASATGVISSFLRKKADRDEYVYFLMALSVVVIYFLYSTLYMWAPHHYGLPIIFFFPLTYFSLCVFTDKTKFKRILPLLLLAFMFFRQGDNIAEAYRIITLKRVPYIIPKYNTGTYHKEIYDAMNKMKKFLESYDGETGYVGIPATLGMPKINGMKINFFHLNSLWGYRTFKSDLLIFWKRDIIYIENFYTRNPHYLQRADNKLYYSIRNGEPVVYYLTDGSSRTAVFEKVFEDEDFDIYRKIKKQKKI